MVTPDIPQTLSLEDAINLEWRMIHHDSNHRYYTWLSVGHEPTANELVKHWFETDAHSRFIEGTFGYNRPRN